MSSFKFFVGIRALAGITSAVLREGRSGEPGLGVGLHQSWPSASLQALLSINEAAFPKPAGWADSVVTSRDEFKGKIRYPCLEGVMQERIKGKGKQYLHFEARFGAGGGVT